MFAKPASEREQEEISKAIRADLIAIMSLIESEPGISLAQIAGKLNWYNKQSKPERRKVQRRVRMLENKKLAERDDDRLELTEKGKKYLVKAKARK